MRVSCLVAFVTRGTTAVVLAVRDLGSIVVLPTLTTLFSFPVVVCTTAVSEVRSDVGTVLVVVEPSAFVVVIGTELVVSGVEVVGVSDVEGVLDVVVTDAESEVGKVVGILMQISPIQVDDDMLGLDEVESP